MSTSCSSKQYHSLTLCNFCSFSSNTRVKRFKSDRTIISVMCLNDSCNRRWSYCSICPKSTRFSKPTQLKRHTCNGTHQQLRSSYRSLLRQNDKPQLTANNSSPHPPFDGDDEIMVPVIHDNNEFDESYSSIQIDTPSLSFFDPSYPNSSTTMENFFIYDNVASSCCNDESTPHLSSNASLNGLRYLVIQALYKNRLESTHICNKQILCHIIIACLASLLSSFENKLLCLLIKMLTDLSSNHSCDMNDSIPTSISQLNRDYLHGKYSIMRNIPTPSIHLNGQHAYLSLKEVIADFLGRKDSDWYDIQPLSDDWYTNNSVQEVGESKAAQQILRDMHRKFPNRRDLLCLFLLEFMDDFNPSKSLISTRGSCWAKTITISPCSTLKNPVRNTYPIAVGPKT